MGTSELSSCAHETLTINRFDDDSAPPRSHVALMGISLQPILRAPLRGNGVAISDGVSTRAAVLLASLRECMLSKLPTWLRPRSA